MFNLTKNYGYQVYGEEKFIGVSGFVRQEGSLLIFSDFSIEETEVKALRRGW